MLSKKIRRNLEKYRNLLISFSNEENEENAKKLIMNNLSFLRDTNNFNNICFSHSWIKDFLDLAVEKGYLEIVKFLIEKHGISVKKYYDDSLLKAVENSHLEIVKILIKHGANVNFLHSEDNTVLFFAIKNQDLEMIKFLVEKGSKIDIINNDGDTALTLTNEFENLEMKNLLTYEFYREGLRKHSEKLEILNPINQKLFSNYLIVDKIFESLIQDDIKLLVKNLKTVKLTLDDQKLLEINREMVNEILTKNEYQNINSNNLKLEGSEFENIKSNRIISKL